MTPSATTFDPTGVCHDAADAAPAMTNALATASATAARFTSFSLVVEGFQSTGKSYRWRVLGRRHAASTAGSSARGADARPRSGRSPSAAEAVRDGREVVSGTAGYLPLRTA